MAKKNLLTREKNIEHIKGGKDYKKLNTCETVPDLVKWLKKNV